MSAGPRGPQARRPLKLLLLAGAALTVMAVARSDPPPPAAEDAELMDPLVMAPFRVNARAIENFGFGVAQRGHGIFVRRISPFVLQVFPNTAAAKAGLKPGDRILASDGRPTVNLSGAAAAMWRGFPTPPEKRADIVAGNPVSWTLLVQSIGETKPHPVTLVLPTSRPRWGSAVWSPPAGRSPATVSEPGILQERARTILDNGVWAKIWTPALTGSLTTRGDYSGYYWHLGRHMMFVTQDRGSTEILLSVAGDPTYYLTSPSGKLDRAFHRNPSDLFHPWKDVPVAGMQEAFAQELNFWLNRVDRVTPRWPLETIPGTQETDPANASAAGPQGLPAAFLRLPPASPKQQALLAQALSKLGASENHWAYTEDIRGADLKTGKGEFLVRVDPSQAEPCTLLQVNGHPPAAEEIKAWRENGPGSTPETFGSLPNPYGLLQIAEARPVSDEPAAVTFEIGLRAQANFPSDKFQALVRVNKAAGVLEDIAIKQREALAVAGPVKLTGVGLEMRFQAVDAQDPPQPVLLKMGGTLQALLVVRISRTFQITRSDFQRVEPRAETLDQLQLAAEAKRELILPMPE